MAKKRKTSSKAAPVADDAGWNDRGGRMGKITSYADVADSEDEFHLNRDKIMLDGGPEAKRRKKWAEEDADLEPSDEEILGYSSGSEEDEEDDADPRKSAQLDSDAEEGAEEEELAEGWGASKKEYYNNDPIETEAHALEEEAEAKRLQQKKLQKMSEADFGFDESEWMDAGNEDDDDGDVVTEVLKDVEITPDMKPEERLRILQTRYPEFDFLANEYLELQPVLHELQKKADAEPSRKSSTHLVSTTVVKSRALAAYLSALAMYFALLASPAKGGKQEGRAMDPAELRDHAVMDSLLQCRELWSKVKSLKAPLPIDELSEDEPILEIKEPKTNSKMKSALSKSTNQFKKRQAKQAAADEEAALRLQRIQQADEELEALSTRLPKSSKRAKETKPTDQIDNNSDFGEEESLDEKAAAAKALKKKSLRFYTSQIVQKSNKRADAGRDAGGDMDLPIKERFRDRQARLNSEAEARGKKLDGYGRGGADLGGESGSEDGEEQAVKMRDDEDEYYDFVAKTSKKKRAEKDLAAEGERQAAAAAQLDRAVDDKMDEDGKRAIGYTIQKNKGLAPKRKKEVRNPRVKKRMKFEEKKKKLSSVRQVWKGGEERGGYGGEKTGIKSGLVKSVKL